MELNITELEYEDIGYVENNKFYPTIQKTSNVSNTFKKKPISYDDILSSLNMKVVDGKLQISRNDHQQIIQNQNQNQTQSLDIGHNQYKNQINQINQRNQINQIN